MDRQVWNQQRGKQEDADRAVEETVLVVPRAVHQVHGGGRTHGDPSFDGRVDIHFAVQMSLERTSRFAVILRHPLGDILELSPRLLRIHS